MQKFSVINAWNTNPDCLCCMLLTLFLGFFFQVRVKFRNFHTEFIAHHTVRKLCTEILFHTFLTKISWNQHILPEKLLTSWFHEIFFFSVIISEICLPTLQFFREIALQYDSNLADLTKFLLNWSYSDATLFWQKFRKSNAFTKKIAKQLIWRKKFGESEFCTCTWFEEK